MRSKIEVLNTFKYEPIFVAPSHGLCSPWINCGKRSSRDANLLEINMTTTNVNFITGKLTWIPLSLELHSRLTSHTDSTTQTFFICCTARPYSGGPNEQLGHCLGAIIFQICSDDKLVSSDILVHQMITTYSTTFFSLAYNYYGWGQRDNCV